MFSVLLLYRSAVLAHNPDAADPPPTSKLNGTAPTTTCGDDWVVSIDPSSGSSAQTGDAGLLEGE